MTTRFPPAPVAQLDRVAGFEPDGWRFEVLPGAFLFADMIDIKLIRQDPERFKQAAAAKRVTCDIDASLQAR